MRQVDKLCKGGREEQKETLVATVSFVLQQRGELSDYVETGGVHSLMIFIAMQT